MTVFTPQRWANEVGTVLEKVLGEERFPVDVEQVALDYTKQRFGSDGIVAVKGGDLPGFEGALMKTSTNRWAILYNSSITSSGRIRFTQAHELGHFLIHREAHPDGIYCPEELVSADSQEAKIEAEANVFAAQLLMPVKHFRSRIDDSTKASFEQLSDCAALYGSSLVATTLQWLSFTERRALLAVSRDGFLLWSRSSQPAARSGAYLAARKHTIEVPEASLANAALPKGTQRSHGAGVWLPEEASEEVIKSDQYDFVLHLLHFEEALGKAIHEDEENVDDTLDVLKFRRR